MERGRRRSTRTISECLIHLGFVLETYRKERYTEEDRGMATRTNGNRASNRSSLGGDSSVQWLQRLPPLRRGCTFKKKERRRLQAPSPAAMGVTSIFRTPPTADVSLPDIRPRPSLTPSPDEFSASTHPPFAQKNQHFKARERETRFSPVFATTIPKSSRLRVAFLRFIYIFYHREGPK